MRRPCCRLRPASALAIGLAGLAFLFVCGCGGGEAGGRDEPGISLSEALGDQTGDDRFARVSGPPEIAFPEAHGPHPAHRQEWWYFTGNLETAEGRRFGYQVTFFRFALDRDPPAPGESDWHATQVYMAHLAVADADGGEFYAEERLARGAVGLAGAEAMPLRVWVENWSLRAAPGTGDFAVAGTAAGARGTDAVVGDRAPADAGTGPTMPASAPSATLPLPREGPDAEAVPPDQGGLRVALDLAGEAIGLELALAAGRPAVLQGEEGYSRKGEAADNASAYYSITRMPTAGRVRVGDEVYEVRGSSWFDREWGTSFLAPGVAGWDWFSLQLDDGRDLMFYRLRADGGGSTRFSGGTLVEPLPGGGYRTEHLDADDVRLEAQDYWTSPQSGVRYPVAWTLTLPRRDLSLEVTPVLRAQELDLAARYWEGAVDVAGTADGAPVSGRGYLELAGYTR